MRFDPRFRFFLLAFFLAGVAFPLAADEKAESVVEREIKQALVLFGMGRSDAAMYMLQQLQQRYPKDDAVLLKLGELAIADKNWAYAIEVLEKLADLKENDVAVRVVLMDIYKAYQMPIQEIKTAGDIIAIDPGHVPTLERLALLYHGENMFREEERVRIMLDEANPGDRDNLEKLAAFYAGEAEVREEIVIRERIHSLAPLDVANNTRLAYLYQEEKSIYQKILLLREVLGAANAPAELAAEYYETIAAYKKSLLIYDGVSSTTGATYMDTFDDRLVTMVEKLDYTFTFLESVSTIRLNLIYTHLFDHPKLNLEQNYNAGKFTTETVVSTASPDNKVNFSAAIGLEQILLYDIGDSVTYPQNTVDFLTLGLNGDYRLFLSGGLDFDAEIARFFFVHASCHSVLFEEIESYLNPLRDNDVGAGLRLLLPDGTSIQGGYELHWIWNELIRSRVTGEFAWIVFSSDAVYDYRGARTGYVKEMPGTRLEFLYEFELLTNADLIPFYAEQDVVHTHAVGLTFAQRLGESLAVSLAGDAKLSSTSDYTVGAKLSIFDLRSDSNVKFSLDLFYDYQNVLPLPDKDTGRPKHEVGLNFFISFNLT